MDSARSWGMGWSGDGRESKQRSQMAASEHVFALPGVRTAACVEARGRFSPPPCIHTAADVGQDGVVEGHEVDLLPGPNSGGRGAVKRSEVEVVD